VDNSGFPASLEVGELYTLLDEYGYLIRVIDESGEPYWFPDKLFKLEERK
jgi:hypothetical protein